MNDRYRGIIRTILFMQKNIQFFAAPFDPVLAGAFQQWAKEHEKEIKPFSDEIWDMLYKHPDSIFYMALAKYRRAILALKEKDYNKIFLLINNDFPMLVDIINRNKGNDIFNHFGSFPLKIKIVDYQEAVFSYKKELKKQIMAQLDNRFFDLTELIQEIREGCESEYWAALSRDEKQAFFLENYCKDTNFAEQVNHYYMHDPSFLITLQRYAVIEQGEKMLAVQDITDAVDTKEAIENFHSHLAANKSLFVKKRDTALMTFVKALGVVAAAILGVGIGGVYAYQRFFGASAADKSAKKFIQHVEQDCPRHRLSMLS